MKFKLGDKVTFVDDEESLINLQSDLLQDVAEGDKTGAFYDKIMTALDKQEPFVISEVDTEQTDIPCCYGITLNGKDVGYMFEEERLKAFNEKGRS